MVGMEIGFFDSAESNKSTSKLHHQECSKCDVTSNYARFFLRYAHGRGDNVALTSRRSLCGWEDACHRRGSSSHQTSLKAKNDWNILSSQMAKNHCKL